VDNCNICIKSGLFGLIWLHELFLTSLTLLDSVSVVDTFY